MAQKAPDRYIASAQRTGINKIGSAFYTDPISSAKYTFRILRKKAKMKHIVSIMTPPSSQNL